MGTRYGNVKFLVGLTMKENPLIVERGGPDFQSVPRYVDPKAVADDDLSPASSPVNSIERSGTGSPCFSTAPLLEGPMAISPLLYPHQLNCYPIVSPSDINFVASTIPPRRPITPISPEISDIILEPKPPPSVQTIAPQKASHVPRRRGPGRPTKAQAAANYPNSKRPTGHSAVKLRRQMHNDSAMRSRARLNKALEELWSAIPLPERTAQAAGGEDNRDVCRAVKVEIAIAYLKKLQTKVSDV